MTIFRALYETDSFNHHDPNVKWQMLLKQFRTVNGIAYTPITELEPRSLPYTDLNSIEHRKRRDLYQHWVKFESELRGPSKIRPGKG